MNGVGERVPQTQCTTHFRGALVCLFIYFVVFCFAQFIPPLLFCVMCSINSVARLFLCCWFLFWFILFVVVVAVVLCSLVDFYQCAAQLVSFRFMVFNATAVPQINFAWYFISIFMFSKQWNLPLHASINFPGIDLFPFVAAASSSSSFRSILFYNCLYQ